MHSSPIHPGTQRAEPNQQGPGSTPPPKSTLPDPSIDHARAQHRQYPSPPKRNVPGHPGPASKTQQATEIQQTPETQQAPEPQRDQHQRNHQHRLQHPPRRPSPPLRHPPPAAESAPCAPAAERPLHKSKQVAPGTAHAPGGSAGGRQASARTRHQRDSRFDSIISVKRPDMSRDKSMTSSTEKRKVAAPTLPGEDLQHLTELRGTLEWRDCEPFSIRPMQPHGVSIGRGARPFA
mmetsp:Transcript_4632/g.10227  ORF Transcript_4632/g.10227 Transcript_4632/m.10227 type:complete len:235 (-) Transcript_4632:1481-2185(-)